MKKIALLLLFLLISVLTTACINNLAVQQLNTKAKEQMSKGDTEAAICRLESSLDLDGNIFETYYNLGVAYIEVKKYEKAVNMLKKATELKPNFADAYYSLAIAQENYAYSIINRDDDADKNKDNDENADDQQENPTLTEKANADKDKPLTVEQKEIVIKNLSESIKMYSEYLSFNPQAKDKESILDKIEIIKVKLGEIQ